MLHKISLHLLLTRKIRLNFSELNLFCRTNLQWESKMKERVDGKKQLKL